MTTAQTTLAVVLTLVFLPLGAAKAHAGVAIGTG